MKTILKFSSVVLLFVAAAAWVSPPARAILRGAQSPWQQHDRTWGTGQVDQKPVRKKHAAEAVYPPEMLKKKVEGAATISFVVTKKGEVEKAQIIKETNLSFGEAARAAVEQWKYKPAKKNGSPVNCAVEVTIKFSIKENGSGGSDDGAGAGDDSQ